jgi:hypothetical protein
MGLFGNLFNKEPKKEKLDEGLEKTKSSVFGKLTKAVAGKSRVNAEVLDELLVTSDVGVNTTVKIIERIEARSLLRLNGVGMDYVEPVYFPGSTAYKNGVEPKAKRPDFRISAGLSPNPAQESMVLTWQADAVFPARTLSVQIRDLSGRLLMELPKVNAAHEMQVINVSELLNGTYVLEMKNADETLYTAKFVVRK